VMDTPKRIFLSTTPVFSGLHSDVEHLSYSIPYIPASDLDKARELLEMSRSLVPKREKSCKETKCIVCGMRDEYHERLTAFLEAHL
jgi:hypothetical protein